MEKDILITMREQVAPPDATRYGLVVGVDQYADSRLNLQCARADAEAMYDLMVNPDCGMFEPDNVFKLLDDEATATAVKECLDELGRRAHPEDTVWIYYSGHGAPDSHRDTRAA